MLHLNDVICRLSTLWWAVVSFVIVFGVLYSKERKKVARGFKPKTAKQYLRAPIARHTERRFGGK
jgi:hypothetical protein